MRKLDKVDWLMFVAAAPLGTVAGAVAGVGVCTAMFWLTGTGNSHSDAFTLFGVMVLGGLVGFIAGPVLVWRRWRAQSPY